MHGENVNVSMILALFWLAIYASAPTLPAAPIVRELPPEPVENKPDQPSNEEEPAPESRPEELDKAQSAYDAGNRQLALALLQQAHAKSKKLPSAELMLAKLDIAHGRLDEAKLLLENIAVSQRASPDVYFLFGEVALRERRLTDAESQFQKGLAIGLAIARGQTERNRLLASSYSGQVAVEEQRGAWSHAASLLEQWVEVEPDNATLHDRWGAALFLDGDEAQAQAQFEKAHQLDDSFHPTLVSMAVMYMQRGNVERAESLFKEAIEAFPNNGGAHFEYSSALLRQDRALEAQQHASKAAELGLDSTELLVHQGLICRQLKEFEEAEAYFERALEKSPGDFESACQLSLVLVEMSESEKLARARELAKLLVTGHPESSYALSTLGWVQYRSGNVDVAEQLMRRAVAQRQVRPETMYFFAKVLIDQGATADAKSAILSLQSAVDQPGLFVLRPDAKKWLQTVSLILK